MEGRTAKGVELENGEKHDSDAVIVNADFSYAVTNIFDKDAIKKYTADKLDQLGYSCSTFMLYLGVDKVYDIPHHNIFFAKDYKSNIDDIVKNNIEQKYPF